MVAGDGLRVFMIVAGLAVLGVAVASLAKKRMTEAFCIAWSALAVMLVCGGIVLRPAGWNLYVSWNGLLLALSGLLVLLAGAFFLSVRVSVLSRQVRELAVQVSLLNQENATIRRELLDGTEKGGAAEHEEDPVRYQYAGPGWGGNSSVGASAPAGFR